jgi:proliferating cell nuclear antigen PCNA
MYVSISKREDVSKFSCIFKNIGNLQELFKLVVTPEGIAGQAMDSAHVCLFELKLEKEWFGEYKVDKQIEIGIAAVLFCKIIDCLKEDQKIILHMNDSDDKLSVDLVGEKGINKYFEIPLIDVDIECINIPETEYDADIEFKSELFTELVGQMSLFHDVLNIKCNGEYVDLTSNGESGKMSVKINDDDILMYAIEEDAEIQLAFSLAYFHKMCLFRKLAPSLFIHLSSDAPMKMVYRLDDTSSDEIEVDDCKNYLRFFLAAKVESD